MATNKITRHSLSTATTTTTPLIKNVLNHLRQPAYIGTPNGLALYRRLQFGRFLASSYLFTNRNLDTRTSEQNEDGEKPWFYAFVDRGCRPETEVWLFGSWEVDGCSPSSHDSLDGTWTDGKPVEQNGIDPGQQQQQQQQQDDTAVQTLLLDFIRAIKTHELPPSIHKPHATENPTTTTTNDDKNPLANTHIMLWGAISAPTTRHLQALSLLATHLLPVVPNHTFLFPLASLPEAYSVELPPNLRWGKLQPQHYPLLRSRTEIARQDFTLERLPGLAIFPVEPEGAAPVAWAFVGLDGSLTTLHTEASHRRMGLGRMLSAKLFREEMERFWEQGLDRVAHGNVMVGNRASASMCKSLGGRDIGEVYWLRVDLDKC
ncbi:hypothetical protein Q7P37_011432 [Cladosporium fusiforme]